MPRTVFVKGEEVRYVQNVSVAHHSFRADEPIEVGGQDAGPNPFELLLAALGTCTNITVRMYADRKGWPLQDVQVRLRFVDAGIEEEVSLAGDLSEDQYRRLIEIAGKCPVHRTLSSPVPIQTRLAPTS
jgi:putative redox protein